MNPFFNQSHQTVENQVNITQTINGSGNIFSATGNITRDIIRKIPDCLLNENIKIDPSSKFEFATSLDKSNLRKIWYGLEDYYNFIVLYRHSSKYFECEKVHDKVLVYIFKGNNKVSIKDNILDDILPTNIENNMKIHIWVGMNKQYIIDFESGYITFKHHV